VVRVWDPSVALDTTLDLGGSTGQGSLASAGMRAVAAWSNGGHVWMSERNPSTGQWSSRLDLGAADSAPSVAVNATGLIAVARGTDAGDVKVSFRAAGAVTFTTRDLDLGSRAVGAARNVQVAVSPAGGITVAWIDPGPTGALRVAAVGGRALNVSVMTAPGPISTYQLVQPGSLSPVLHWLSEVGTPKVKLWRAVPSTSTANTWDAAHVVLPPAGLAPTTLSTSATSDGRIVMAYTAAGAVVPGVYSTTRTAGGLWLPFALVPGTDATATSADVSASAGGAATLVWSTSVAAVITMRVTDRGGAASAWGAPTELPYIAGLAFDPFGVPSVSRGADGRSIVTWAGYGATSGAITTFTGRGTSWVAAGDIFSDDATINARPLMLSDGTAVAAGRVVDSIFTNTYAFRVREGRLVMTGPAAAGPAGISGTARVGGKLVCTSPVFAPIPATTTYAWLRNGVTITGAKASSYAPVAADLGKAVQCRVTATITGALAGSTAVLSAARVITVGLAPKASARSVAVLGTHKVGVKQTCRLGTWAPTASYTRTVRWLRDGTAIAGATSATYTPSTSMRGHKLACRVTAARAGYTKGVATSAAVTIG
jgi:hypothetical protein